MCHDAFWKLIRPSFPKDISDEDVCAIMKRVCIRWFTNDWVYYRPPDQHQVWVKRTSWPSKQPKDLLVPTCKAKHALYKREREGSYTIPEEYEHDMEWSKTLVRRLFEGLGRFHRR